jgi:hypothetical protein
MRKPWSERTTGSVIVSTLEPIANALRRTPRHGCDPDGFNCDCARKLAVNGRRGANWIQRERTTDWLLARGRAR